MSNGAPNSNLTYSLVKPENGLSGPEVGKPVRLLSKAVVAGVGVPNCRLTVRQCSLRVSCEPVLLHVTQVGFILAIVTCLLGIGALGDQRYHAVEYFAGCKSWATGLTDSGYQAATFEILDADVNQDMLSAAGFVTAIQYIFEVCC